GARVKRATPESGSSAGLWIPGSCGACHRAALCADPLARPAMTAQEKRAACECTSGPSLGRKRPRRAAIARGATAPQQYATALHKRQGVLHYFPCKTDKPCKPATPIIIQ